MGEFKIKVKYRRRRKVDMIMRFMVTIFNPKSLQKGANLELESQWASLELPLIIQDIFHNIYSNHQENLASIKPFNIDGLSRNIEQTSP